jgi:hypothetical protein
MDMIMSFLARPGDRQRADADAGELLAEPRGKSACLSMSLSWSGERRIVRYQAFPDGPLRRAVARAPGRPSTGS